MREGSINGEIEIKTEVNTITLDSNGKNPILWYRG